MTPEQVLADLEEVAGEWLEMSENPAELMAGILAARVIKLTEYIEYLERRLKHATDRIHTS